jgi:predicted transcriptional regulator
MEVFWSSPTTPRTVRDVHEQFPDHAYTTIMTVLSRLTKKGFLREEKRGRVNTFLETAAREDYITGLIMEALSSTNDREAVLARFADGLAANEKSLFRALLRRREKSDE